nr:hypothetical protein [Ferrimicrobium acidiphilum]
MWWGLLVVMDLLGGEEAPMVFHGGILAVLVASTIAYVWSYLCSSVVVESGVVILVTVISVGCRLRAFRCGGIGIRLSSFVLRSLVRRHGFLASRPVLFLGRVLGSPDMGG